MALVRPLNPRPTEVRNGRDGKTRQERAAILLDAREGQPVRVPPTEVLLLPFGRISTRKGTFLLTVESANELILNYKEHGVDLNIDFEHASMSEPTGNPSPAAGWAKLDLRDDGIWLTDIKWTDRMKQFLINGEYRYLSPAFAANKDTHEIIDLLNVAVTNVPAMDGIEALVAASRVECKIVKRGNKWQLYSSDGKKLLGTHDTKAQAQAQESAINISKARKAGHRIPKKASQGAGGVLRHDCNSVTNGPKKETNRMTLQERLKKYVLSRADMTVGQLANGLGIEVATLKKYAAGAMPSQEEMKALKAAAKMAKMDIFEGESEEAAIDASLNGGDVNAMASGLFDTARGSSETSDITDTTSSSSESEETMDIGASEVNIPVSGDEASENANSPDSIAKAIGMRMSRERENEILKLTGRKDIGEAMGVIAGWRATSEIAAKDHEEVVRLRREADARERAQLIDQGKRAGKLTPALIDLFKSKSNAEFRAFLSVAPGLVDSNGGHREIAPGGESGGPLGLTQEQIMVESLVGSTGDPKEIVALSRVLAPALAVGGSQMTTLHAPEFSKSLLDGLMNPKTEPVGWRPRKAA